MGYQTEPGLRKSTRKEKKPNSKPKKPKQKEKEKIKTKNQYTPHHGFAALKNEPVSNSCFLTSTLPKFLLKRLSLPPPQS